MQHWPNKWRGLGLTAMTASLLSSCLLTSSFEGLTGGPGAPDAGAGASEGSSSASSTSASGGGGASSASSGSSGSSGVGGAFPSTPLLDDFNRPNGAPGSRWFVEDVGNYSVANNQLVCVVGDPGVILWTDVYGPDQEAWVTINARDDADVELELLVKSQKGIVQECDSLQLDYQYPNLELHKCVVVNNNPVFEDVGQGISLSIAPGDQIGVRAYANGTVEAYHNGKLVKSWNVTSWPFYKEGGRIGWASYGIMKPALIDNFGGGG
jgi:hypothetical protein